MGCGVLGQRSAAALAERVAAISAVPPEYAGESGRECLWGRFAVEFSEWVPVWRGPGEAGTTRGSVSDHEVGIDRRGRAAVYSPRFVTCRANRNLRSVSHVFHGCGARTGTLA